MDVMAAVFIFILASVVGFELIAKIPPTLHTPLMSAANAVSGITIVGALIASGSTDWSLHSILGLAAVFFAILNVIGGYLVTDRMLCMFRKK